MDTIHDLRSGSPESLAARAFAGFWRAVKTGRKTALTTGLTTDRKNFHFRPQRGIIAKTEYPGVAELVPRRIWDAEIARSSRVTRTKNPLKSMISEGFAFSLFIAAQRVRAHANLKSPIFMFVIAIFYVCYRSQSSSVR